LCKGITDWCRKTVGAIQVAISALGKSTADGKALPDTPQMLQKEEKTPMIYVPSNPGSSNSWLQYAEKCRGVLNIGDADNALIP
jgi:hypothetical protein